MPKEIGVKETNSDWGDQFIVGRRDGGIIDFHAKFFVLRLDTDPVARDAMRAYAGIVEESDPKLANEILRRLHACEPLFRPHRELSVLEEIEDDG